MVLLTIAHLGSEAYGLGVLRNINERTNRNLSIGSLHSTLTRLEEKGYLTSYKGEPTKERGGKRKRYFQLTNSARSVLLEMKSLRDELWKSAQTELSL